MVSSVLAASLSRRRIHYSWVILAVTFLTMLVMAGAVGAPGVFIKPLEAEFGWDTAEISSALAVRFALFGLVGPFAAAFMNHFGVRKVVLTALTLGQRFGVIAILPGSIPRHLRAYGAMGVQSRLAGELAIGLNVTDLADYDRTLARMCEVGLRLRDTQGADVIVMGCAGMAVYRDALQEALGIPVVEPSQAAAAMAIGRIKMNWHGA